MGKINKSRINFKQIDNLIKDLGQKWSIRVGIIGNKAYQKHEGTDLTNAELGAAHEFGAIINHPGGTPYYINSSTGKAVFVSKNSLFGKHLIEKGQVTKPHTIILYTRSFLRKSILSPEGQKEIKQSVYKKTKNYLSNDRELNKYMGDMMEDFAYVIALEAFEKVRNTFINNEIIPPTKPSSKKKRHYNQNAPTLIDEGQNGGLLGSISYEVKQVK